VHGYQAGEGPHERKSLRPGQYRLYLCPALRDQGRSGGNREGHDPQGSPRGGVHFILFKLRSSGMQRGKRGRYVRGSEKIRNLPNKDLNLPTV